MFVQRRKEVVRSVWSRVRQAHLNDGQAPGAFTFGHVRQSGSAAAILTSP